MTQPFLSGLLNRDECYSLMTPQHLRITLFNEKLSVGGQRLHRFAQEWLKAGLMNLGAGAKTSAGYGYFVSPPQPCASVAQAQPAQAAAEPSPESLTWRTGAVKEYWPDRHMGRLVDDESGEELSFSAGGD